MDNDERCSEWRAEKEGLYGTDSALEVPQQPKEAAEKGRQPMEKPTGAWLTHVVPCEAPSALAHQIRCRTHRTDHYNRQAHISLGTAHAM